MTSEEFKSIENLFKEHSNPAKIVQMTKYMKDRFTYLGITSPERKKLLKNIFYGYSWNREQVMSFVEIAWKSDYRELHYAGLDVMQKHKKKLIIDDLPFLEALVTTNSWWDTVDNIAVHPIGQVLLLDEAMRQLAVAKWANSQNLWLRRTAILHQLKYKDRLDVELMELTIKKAMGTKEFFLNKAIGWILREYSRTDPEYVVAFCNKNELSKLSRREAKRLIG